MEATIKERGMLFSGPMVRALLAGTKTQTRRAVKLPNGRVSKKPQPMPDYIGRWVKSADANLWAGFGTGETRPDGVQNTVNTMRTGWFPCPYGQPGDRLWVRETLYWDECGEEWRYQAGNDPVLVDEYAGILAKPKPAIPSIHMPRAASRLLLEIVAVRVERVQSISERDMRAEGCQVREFSFIGASTKEERQQVAADIYGSLWQSINGYDSWAANPWVWVVEFKVVEPEPASPQPQEGAQGA